MFLANAISVGQAPPLREQPHLGRLSDSKNTLLHNAHALMSLSYPPIWSFGPLRSSEAYWHDIVQAYWPI